MIYSPSREPKRAELFVWSSRALHDLRRLSDTRPPIMLENPEAYAAEAAKRAASKYRNYQALAEDISNFGERLKGTVATYRTIDALVLESALADLAARIQVFLPIEALVEKTQAPRVRIIQLAI